VTVVRLGSRTSRLALAQAATAADRLRGLGHAVAIVPLSTTGDRDRRRSFHAFSERGIFTSELERALLDGRIDVAVHSAKDLTGVEHDGLVLAACLERADPRDAWCGPARSLDEVPDGGRVGTSSTRRASLLAYLRPDLVVEPLRGNVETRLARRVERNLDGVMLAACGLDRIDRAADIGFRFATDVLTPEAGQGIVALQVRDADRGLVEAVDHLATSRALTAERRCVRLLEGGCTTPVAAYARAENGVLVMTGFVERAGEALFATESGSDPLELAALVAGSLGVLV